MTQHSKTKKAPDQEPFFLRIKSGLAEARRKGKRIGQPSSSEDLNVMKNKYTKLIADLQKGNSLTECCKLHGVSRNTVIKIKKLS